MCYDSSQHIATSTLQFQSLLRKNDHRQQRFQRQQRSQYRRYAEGCVGTAARGFLDERQEGGKPKSKGRDSDLRRLARLRKTLEEKCGSVEGGMVSVLDAVRPGSNTSTTTHLKPSELHEGLMRLGVRSKDLQSFYRFVSHDPHSAVDLMQLRQVLSMFGSNSREVNTDDKIMEESTDSDIDSFPIHNDDDDDSSYGEPFEKARSGSEDPLAFLTEIEQEISNSSGRATFPGTKFSPAVNRNRVTRCQSAGNFFADLERRHAFLKQNKQQNRPWTAHVGRPKLDEPMPCSLAQAAAAASRSVRPQTCGLATRKRPQSAPRCGVRSRVSRPASSSAIPQQAQPQQPPMRRVPWSSSGHRVVQEGSWQPDRKVYTGASTRPTHRRPQSAPRGGRMTTRPTSAAATGELSRDRLREIERQEFMESNPFLGRGRSTTAKQRPVSAPRGTGMRRPQSAVTLGTSSTSASFPNPKSFGARAALTPMEDLSGGRNVGSRDSNRDRHKLPQLGARRPTSGQRPTSNKAVMNYVGRSARWNYGR